MSGFRGKVRIKKVLTDKVAPTRNEEKLQDEERVRSEGKTSGEESSQGKESVSKEKGRGHRRGRGKELAWEEQLPQDEGEGWVYKGRDEEQKPSKLQARNRSGDRGSAGRGEGAGKVRKQDPERGGSRGRTRYLGRARARTMGRCEEKWGAGQEVGAEPRAGSRPEELGKIGGAQLNRETETETQ